VHFLFWKKIYPSYIPIKGTNNAKLGKSLRDNERVLRRKPSNIGDLRHRFGVGGEGGYVLVSITFFKVLYSI
jgi:hypothetical protein